MLFNQYGEITRPNRIVAHGINKKGFDVKPIGKTFIGDVMRPGAMPPPMITRAEIVSALLDNVPAKGLELNFDDPPDAIKVLLPDPSDTTWQKEGRLQAHTWQKVNYGAPPNKLNALLATIAQGLANARTETPADKARVLAMMEKIVSDKAKLAKLDAGDMEILANASKAIGITEDWRSVPGNTYDNFVLKDEWKANSILSTGAILRAMVVSHKLGRSATRPIIRYWKTGKKGKAKTHEEALTLSEAMKLMEDPPSRWNGVFELNNMVMFDQSIMGPKDVPPSIQAKKFPTLPGGTVPPTQYTRTAPVSLLTKAPEMKTP